MRSRKIDTHVCFTPVVRQKAVNWLSKVKKNADIRLLKIQQTVLRASYKERHKKALVEMEYEGTRTDKKERE